MKLGRWEFRLNGSTLAWRWGVWRCREHVVVWYFDAPQFETGRCESAKRMWRLSCRWLCFGPLMIGRHERGNDVSNIR